MKYCHECGKELIKKPCADEGLVGFCENCNQFRYEYFATVVLVVVLSPDKKYVCLLRQNYVHKNHYVLIAGYVKKGQTLEETVCAEVQEESGLNVVQMQYVTSYFHEKSGSLMAGFLAQADSFDIQVTSEEVDDALWVPLEEATKFLKFGSTGEKFFKEVLNIL